jgi:hypothetical protein
MIINQKMADNQPRIGGLSATASSPPTGCCFSI